MQAECPKCGSRLDSTVVDEFDTIVCTVCGSDVAGSQTQSVAAPAPRKLGRFELIRQLGSGAFGTVWKALDPQLDRLVAVKIPRRGQLSPDEAQRFLTEARASAQLRHPNIVSVHEVGQDGDIVFIVADLIDGVTMADWLTRHHPTPRTSALLCTRIATALHHAHQHGVVHRDLKPSNIMLTSEDGNADTESEHLQPCIMDFGLAKRESANVTATMAGTLLGTPAYMSPEQARGEGYRADRRSDVFSLGVILYELLTRELPFQGTVTSLLDQVLHSDPTQPRKLNPSLSRDLETICLKCLQKSPEDRYPTASDLAADLRRFNAGEAILARPDPLPRKVARKLRRHRTAIVIASTLLVALALVVVLLPKYYFRQTNQYQSEIRARMQTVEISESFLASVEPIIDDLERLDHEEAARARHDLYHTFAGAAGQRIKARVNEESVSLAETAIESLENRDPALADELAQLLRNRLSRWHELFRLPSPSTEMRSVFADPAIILDENRRLVFDHRSPDRDERIITQINVSGDVKFKAEIDAVDWEHASSFGLLLNAQDADQGYEFLLSAVSSSGPAKGPAVTIGEVRRADGEVMLEIRRNSKRLRARRVPSRVLPDGPVTIEASRRGDVLSLTVGDNEPLTFHDIFAIPSHQGAFGVIWPEGVGLWSLSAERRQMPITPSPLEQGDQLYSQGPDAYQKALRSYDEQLADTRDPQLIHEIRYKQSLCLLGLHRSSEALELLEPLASETAKPWTILARMQLLRLYFRLDRLDDLDKIINSLIYANPEMLEEFLDDSSNNRFENLARLVPDEFYVEMIDTGFQRYGGLQVVRFDRKNVQRLEWLLNLTEYANLDPAERLQLKIVLSYAHRITGHSDQAIKVLDPIVRSPETSSYSASELVALVGWYCWVLRDREETDPQSAIDLINTWLYDGPKSYRPGCTSLLLTRARVEFHRERFQDAERDLDEFFRVTAPEQMHYPDHAEAFLLRGFLHQQAGDLTAAQDAWREGLFKNYTRAPERPRAADARIDLFIRARTMLDGIVLGALTDELTTADYDQLLNELRPAIQSQVPFPLPSEPLHPFSVSTLRQSFNQPLGRAYARKLASMDLGLREYYETPYQLVVVEQLRRVAFGRQLTPQEHQVLWDTADAAYRTFLLGDMTLQEVATGIAGPLFMVWTDSVGAQPAWRFVAGKLQPDLRGGIAYILGKRFQRSGKAEFSQELFRTALQDAPPASTLHQLIEAELKGN